MRNFNFYNSGKMNAKILDPETRSFLEAFSNGINDYARNARLLPLEFYLTWTEWEEWTVDDTLAQLAFFSFCLEFDWMYELARQRLL